jgi:DNA-binding protein YbaB
MLAINNLSELRAQVKKLHEQCVQQEAHIKKLEFELEMEQGHVKILRHDNKMLRQMAVDMVIIHCYTTRRNI